MGEGDVGPVLPAQFEAWFRLYGRDLFAYVACRVGPGPAEDVVAQTFSEAWKHLDRFDPTRGTARSWLFGIATNLVHRHRRAEARRLAAYARAGAVEWEALEGLEDLTDALDAEVRWRAIAVAMQSLRPEERDIVWLAASGLTYAEIAQVLDIPVGTVRSRFSRLRAKLADAGVTG